MPVAIDTSVLVQAEKQGDFESLLPPDEDGPFYIPALAAAEFLLGTHPPVRAELRHRALRMYHAWFQSLVSSFSEADAAQLAALNAELRRTGQTMGFYDSAIAATVIARGDSLLALDGDYDRLKERIELLKP
jgi:predicted nucleic acid-binding protein